MKNAIKLSGAMLRMAISAIVLVGVLVAVSLSMTACDNGTTSGDGNGNKILGLSYSMKIEYKSENKYDPITNPYTTDGTIYILEHSFEEAYAIVTKQLGSPRYQQISSHFYYYFSDYVAGNPGWVVLEEEHGWGGYRLTHKYLPDDPNDTTTDGFGWDKPYEKEGTLRITGIPEQLNSFDVTFRLWDKKHGDVWGPTNGSGVILSYPWYVNMNERPGATIINNGSVDIPLWWIPNMNEGSYDRKNGTFNEGERYEIYLVIHDKDPPYYPIEAYSFPSITFVNGHAELDFSKAKYYPEGAK